MLVALAANTRLLADHLPASGTPIAFDRGTGRLYGSPATLRLWHACHVASSGLHCADEDGRRATLVSDARGLSLVAAANHVYLRTLAPGGEDSLAEVDPGSLTIVQHGVSWLLRHIRHTAGVYAFFAHLVQATHQHRDHELCWWETEAVCEQRYRVHEQWHNLRPDALADYQCGTRHFQFWLEWDRGTMNVRDLTIKFTAYAEYLASHEWGREYITLPTLVCVAPELAQEQRIWHVASAVLTQTPGLVLATTTETLLAHDGPLAAIWQMVLWQQRGPERGARRSLFRENAEASDQLQSPGVRPL